MNFYNNLYHFYIPTAKFIVDNCLPDQMNIEVIYGDTDSIMVNTQLVDYNEVISLGNKVLFLY